MLSLIQYPLFCTMGRQGRGNGDQVKGLENVPKPREKVGFDLPIWFLVRGQYRWHTEEDTRKRSLHLFHDSFILSGEASTCHYDLLSFWAWAAWKVKERQNLLFSFSLWARKLEGRELGSKRWGADWACRLQVVKPFHVHINDVESSPPIMDK